MRIFHVMQDIDYLYGTYVTRAVVVANSSDEATKLLTDWCRVQEDDYTDPIVIQADRLTVKVIGTSDLKEPAVLAAETGEDLDEPPSWSDADTPEDDGDDEDDEDEE